jgi:osmotically inducible lipoprotein OsmB
MKAIQRQVVGALTAAMLLGLTGCAGMSERDRNTAIGAGVGAGRGVSNEQNIGRFL